MVAAVELSTAFSATKYNLRGTSMKTVVRAFVLVLTLTYTKLATASPLKSGNNKLAAPLSIGGPVPCCEPDDPDACGLGKKH